MPEIGSLVRPQLGWDGTLGLKHPLLGIKTREGDMLLQVNMREKRNPTTGKKFILV